MSSSIVTKKGMNEWNIAGGTEMTCETLISVNGPTTYKCDVHEPKSERNPYPKQELIFMSVDHVMVLKNSMSAEAKRGISKYSFNTRTKCNVQHGMDKELEEDITTLICSDLT